MYKEEEKKFNSNDIHGLKRYVDAVEHIDVSNHISAPKFILQSNVVDAKMLRTSSNNHDTLYRSQLALRNHLIIVETSVVIVATALVRDSERRRWNE